MPRKPGRTRRSEGAEMLRASVSPLAAGATMSTGSSTAASLFESKYSTRCARLVLHAMKHLAQFGTACLHVASTEMLNGDGAGIAG